MGHSEEARQHRSGSSQGDADSISADRGCPTRAVSQQVGKTLAHTPPSFVGLGVEGGWVLGKTKAEMKATLIYVRNIMETRGEEKTGDKAERRRGGKVGESLVRQEQMRTTLFLSEPMMSTGVRRKSWRICGARPLSPSSAAS